MHFSVIQNSFSLQIVRAAKHYTQVPGETIWPLTGGIPCQLHDAGDYQVERVYIAGYQDGSIRIWDATYPSFSLILYLEPEVCIHAMFSCKFQFQLYSPVKLFCLCQVMSKLISSINRAYLNMACIIYR